MNVYDSNLALHYNCYKVSFKTIALKGYLTQRDEWLSLFQFYRENFLTSRSVDPKQPSHFHFVPSLKLSQGEVHDLSGEVEKFSGEVQNDLRGGAHLSTPRLKIRP